MSLCLSRIPGTRSNEAPPSLAPTRQFSKQLNCVHDYMLPACAAPPASQKGEVKDPEKAGLYARKESPYQNHSAQMLTDQAGSQKHLGEVTGLVGWFVAKFPLYLSKLSFLCTTRERCVSNTLF